jgi:hypothetical protein
LIKNISDRNRRLIVFDAVARFFFIGVPSLRQK